MANLGPIKENIWQNNGKSKQIKEIFGQIGFGKFFKH